MSHNPSMHHNRRKSSIKVFVRKSLHNIADPQCVLERTERRLEEELVRETRRQSLPTTNRLQRIRSKGEWLLHSKMMLLTIVFLNVVDCALVLGEIMLDIHHVTDLMEQTESTQLSFMRGIQTLHPAEFRNYSVDDIHLVFEKLINENWTRCIGLEDHVKPDRRARSGHNDVGYNVTNIADQPVTKVREVNMSNVIDAKKELIAGQLERASIRIQMIQDEHVAHKMHKTSIAILSFLLIESLVKTFCVGLGFFRNPLEVFDFLVVLVSFIIDLVYIKGLTSFHVRELVFILTFILPWRIIRVLNSLLVAVLEHEHFRMKLLYSEKKHIAAELKDLTYKEDKFEGILQDIEDYCETKGIPRWKIRQHTVFGNIHQNTVSSLALGAGNLLNIMLQKRSICETSEQAPLKVPIIVTTAPRPNSLPDYETGLLDDHEEEENTGSDDDSGHHLKVPTSIDVISDDDEDDDGDGGSQQHGGEKMSVHFLPVPSIQS